jgi:hypothetical protein
VPPILRSRFPPFISSRFPSRSASLSNIQAARAEPSPSHTHTHTHKLSLSHQSSRGANALTLTHVCASSSSFGIADTHRLFLDLPSNSQVWTHHLRYTILPGRNLKLNPSPVTICPPLNASLFANAGHQEFQRGKAYCTSTKDVVGQRRPR